MSINSGEMLKVGPFIFSVETAAYTKMDRSDDYRWVEVERLGKPAANQYIGPGTREITLTGIVYTLYDRGRSIADPMDVVGTEQIKILRQAADKGVPYTVTSGRGEVLGKWVILSVREGASVFLVNGAPKKQEFDVTLREYGGESGAGGILGGILGGVTGLFTSLNAIQTFNRMPVNGINPTEDILAGLREVGLL